MAQLAFFSLDLYWPPFEIEAAILVSSLEDGGSKLQNPEKEKKSIKNLMEASFIKSLKSLVFYRRTGFITTPKNFLDKSAYLL